MLENDIYPFLEEINIISQNIILKLPRNLLIHDLYDKMKIRIHDLTLIVIYTWATVGTWG